MGALHMPLTIRYSQPTLEALFTATHVYRVPRYQRPFSWQATEIDQLWADVSDVTPAGFFIGPAVIYEPTDHDGESDVREIIDGQQRLTSLQVLIALIRDRFIGLGNPYDEYGQRLSDVPHNLIWRVGQPPSFRLQTSEQHREILEDFVLRAADDPARRRIEDRQQLLTADNVTRVQSKTLIDAYKRLSAHLTTFLEASADPLGALRQLQAALFRRVTFVVLDMTNLDDAFVLFETLNQRGRRLSATDLVKSHLLGRISADANGNAAAVNAAADSWDDVVEEFRGSDTTQFLRHYLLLRSPRVRAADIFPKFRDQVGEVGSHAALDEVASFGYLYAEFLHPSQGGLQELLLDLRGTGVDTLRVALLPARRWLDEQTFIQFARLTERLAFRWTTVGGNAQQLESLFQRAAHILFESQGTQVAAARDLLADPAVMPSDTAFKEAVAVGSPGKTPSLGAYVLRKVERATAPGDIYIPPPAVVHVEHIMPKGATPFWRARLGNHLEYGEVVQRWGNLTLLLAELNQSIKNGDWNVKKHGAQGHAGYDASAVRLTTDLLPLPDWNEDLISLRTKWIAIWASRIWSDDPDNTDDLPAFAETIDHPEVLDAFWP
jgi:hypothetical protein